MSLKFLPDPPLGRDVVEDEEYADGREDRERSVAVHAGCGQSSLFRRLRFIIFHIPKVRFILLFDILIWDFLVPFMVYIHTINNVPSSRVAEDIKYPFW